MIRCAVIEPTGDIVVNIVEYESIPVGDVPGFPPGHYALAADGAQIGWHWDGNMFVDPSPPAPSMDYLTLYDAISEVCPIESLTMGDPTDRSTWTFVPAPGATPEQIAAAENVIDTLPFELQTMIVTSEWVGRFTNAEYRAATAAAWRGVAGNAKNWDAVITDNPIKLDRKKVITLRDSLVADGILTAARATEIFS